MKKTMSLLVLGTAAIGVLSSCSNNIEDILGPGGATRENVLTNETLLKARSDVTLKGKFTEWIKVSLDGGEERYGENTADLEVSFKEESYYYNFNGPDEQNVGKVFKIGGVPTVSGINLKNEVVFAEMKDNDDNVESWSNYSNPFNDLSVYDFLKTDKDGVYTLRLDTESAKNNALSFVTKVTNHSFPEIEKVEVTLENGDFSSLYILTPEFETYLGNTYFESTLKFDAFGTDVPNLEYDTPLPTKPEHEKLSKALTKLNTTDFNAAVVEYNASELGDWENATKYEFDTTYSEDLVYLYDRDWGQGSGYILVDGKGYTISTPRDVTIDTAPSRSFYPSTNSSGEELTSLIRARGDFEIAAPEHFEVVDDKHFYVEGIYAGTIAYYYSMTGNPFAKSCKRVDVELDDNYDIKKIVMQDEGFDKYEQVVTAYGENVEIPFDVSQITVDEDPFLKFIGTFKGTETKTETEHTLVITSLTEATLDGVEIEDLAYDKKNTLTGKIGNLSYRFYYSTYSNKISVSYEDPNDSKVYGYYDVKK